MANPWLDIPLADYEAHMALPDVAQAPMLAGVLGDMLALHRPRSLAVIGCAGGNGFERIDPQRTARVVGVDINRHYIAACRDRFGSTFPTLELICADVQQDSAAFAPVDLIFAGLIFEYVDAAVVMQRLAAQLNRGGVLGCVLQLPIIDKSVVTASAYTSLRELEPFMRLLPRELLVAHAARAGLRLATSACIELATGKRFQHIELHASN